MLKICLVSWKSEPQYTYKRYAYKKHVAPFCIKIVKRQATFSASCVAYEIMRIHIEHICVRNIYSII